MSLLVTAEALEARGRMLEAAPDLAQVRDGLRADLERVLAQPLYVPDAKALLSRWGAHCRDDGAELAFDPFAPHRHRCAGCGQVWDTDQTHRWWVYWYQLWLAERVWVMALLSGMDAYPAAEARALETLAALAARYDSWPNADNVLGPSRPFFSTYLESIWVLQLVAAASLLAARGRLPADLGRDLKEQLFRPSSALIADFDEGRSNRQAWNAAALFALGRYLGDAAMARAAAHGPSGILAVTERGLARDGLWFEGENYHWFALRGLAWGAELLREAGEVDLWRDGGPVGRRFVEAFRAPILTVQPDFTFPARRDSKFGVSLAQRRMAELWELARCRGVDVIDAVLSRIYDPPTPRPPDAPTPDPSSITEVERAAPARGVRRDALGWKGLLWMRPEAPPADAPWRPATAHLQSSGIAIFRRDEGATYVGLDYGESGGGHGHPDRLQLTLWHRGAPWLVDFGTGAYTAPTLSWYRSTLAHNAPLVDGHSQAPARGRLVAFDERGEHGWICALLPEGSAYDGATIQRTVVLAPGYLLDIVQLGSDTARSLAVPWHGLGRPLAAAHGITFEREGESLRVHLAGRQPFQALIQRAPGPPSGPGGTAEELEFAVVVGSGEHVTLVAAVELGAGLAEVECKDEDFLVRFSGGDVDTHRATDEGWIIERPRGDPVELGGLTPDDEAGVEERGVEGSGGRRAEVPEAYVRRVEAPPALDGTLTGFPTDALLLLDRADQFRRAEDPWPGRDAFSARALLAHDRSALYVAVDVTHPELWFRPAELPDPEWENENPDIHSDGVQLFVEGAGFYGWLLVPEVEAGSGRGGMEGREGRKVRVAGVRGTDGDPAMVSHAAWQRTARGYCLTCAVEVPDLLAQELRFDLCVNGMREGRERRWGQMVWSGARGSRLYLAGDRPVAGALPRVSVE